MVDPDRCAPGATLDPDAPHRRNDDVKQPDARWASPERAVTGCEELEEAIAVADTVFASLLSLTKQTGDRTARVNRAARPIPARSVFTLRTLHANPPRKAPAESPRCDTRCARQWRSRRRP